MGAEMVISEIRQRLFALRDLSYRDFHAALMPNIDKETVIGVRVPEVRKLAKEFAKHPDIQLFLKDLPHAYYEENNFHALIVMAYKNADECVCALDTFLPYVNNWATCDLIKPAPFAKDYELAERNALRWISSNEPYTVRLGIEMLMKFCLGKGFKREHLELVVAIRSDEYYINMMRAWYFAEALIKQQEAALPYLEQQHMDTWTHNKAIQKAVESYRVSADLKAYLRTLKVK